MKVREAIRRVEADGWFLLRTSGSHRQFKHDRKSGKVTIAGKPSLEIPPGTLRSIFKQACTRRLVQAGPTRMKYAIVIEQGPSSFGAYVPDLPGCVAVAESEAEVRSLIAEAIVFHLDGMREDGDPRPEPTARVDYVQVGEAA